MKIKTLPTKTITTRQKNNKAAAAAAVVAKRNKNFYLIYKLLDSGEFFLYKKVNKNAEN